MDLYMTDCRCVEFFRISWDSHWSRSTSGPHSSNTHRLQRRSRSVWKETRPGNCSLPVSCYLLIGM